MPPSPKEPNDLSSTVPVTSNNGEPDSLCIKCNIGGNLLVCSEAMCPLTCHVECLGCPPHFDCVGRFLCPYCAYKLVMLEVRKAEKEVVLARKALSIFLVNPVVDDDAGAPVMEKMDMVRSTDQNLTLKEVVHRSSDKVQIDVPEVRSDHECNTSGVPCDGATSSALNEPNGMLGNVSGKSDEGRDSHREEETADIVELEPSENVQEKNSITLDSCQQTRVGIESEKGMEGIFYDSEVEEEYTTTVDDLQNQRVVGHHNETDVTVKRRKLIVETDKSMEEETLPDAETEQEKPETVDDIQSKRMAQCDQEPVTIRRRLSIETEKSMEEDTLFDVETEQEKPETVDDIQSKRMAQCDQEPVTIRRRLSIETEKSMEEDTLFDVEIEHEKPEAINYLQSKRMSQCDQEPATIRKKKNLNKEPEKIEGTLNDTETEEGNPLTVDSGNKGMSQPRQKAALVRKRRNLSGEPEKPVELQRRNIGGEAEKDVEEQRGNLVGEHEKAVEEQRKNLGGERETAVEEQRRNLGGETEKTVQEQLFDKDLEEEYKSRQSIPTGYPSLKRKKWPWTAEEEEMLKVGVARFTHKANKNIPWKKILDFGRHVFHGTRAPDNLKDKWRKMGQ